MVFPSVPPYLDQDQQPPISIDNQQPRSGVGNGDDASQLPKSMPERARLAKLPQPEAALKCPRCGSTNTKFCYYNNYSLSQPRYFCKACRRYWTRGGNLRNVPVGGGCRRSKRSASSKSSSIRLQPPSASSSGRATGATIPPAPSLASMAPNHLPFLRDNIGLTSISTLPPLEQQQPEDIDLLFPLASGGRLGVSLEHRRSAHMQHEPLLWGMGGETDLPLPPPTQTMPPLIYHMDLEATARMEEGLPLHMAGTRQPENAGGSGWTMTDTIAAPGILFSGGGF